MAVGVLMPKAGITVEECVISEWKKKKGDQVKIGDVLFTYETDKAEFECESTAEGELLEIFYEEGDEVPVLVNVCAVGAPGDDISGIRDSDEVPTAQVGEEAASEPAPEPKQEEKKAAPRQATGPVASAVVMPKAGITVEECVISEWKKQVGDHVDMGEVLFTYETDKAEFECESTAEGELLAIFYEEGDEVPVLANVCAVGNPGDSIEGLQSGEAAVESEAEPAAEPEAAPAAAAETAAPKATGSDVKISPRARKAAADLGVDGTKAAGSGPYGRILEADVKAYAKEAPMEAAAPQAAAPASDQPEYVDEKFSTVRKTTAKAMHDSLSSMAQLTHQHSFDATAIRDLRAQIKAQGEAYGLPNITLNDIVLFAVSRVLMHHPDLNATVPEENVLRRYTNVHLGMAVDTPRGLMVPTIFNANKMSLAEISMESKRLAKACQEGKATLDMLEGATFTVSNLGSLGVEMFTPVINPPQVAILGVCGITDRVREVDGQIQVYPSMGLSLTYDHRAIDGTPASKFMKELCDALEHITLLLMK